MGLVVLVARRLQHELVTLEPTDSGVVGIAQTSRLGDDAVEHLAQVAGVGADELEDRAGRGLQLERLGQLAVAFLDLDEEAGVVDGDRCLVDEGLQQRHLGIGVSAGDETGEGDDAERDVVADHGDGEGALGAGPPARGVRVSIRPARRPSSGCG